jgi:hypothetical protein
MNLMALALYAAASAVLGQASSTAPVEGPSPGYSTSSKSDSPPPEAGWVAHRVDGVVTGVLPTDPYAAGEHKVIVTDAEGNQHLFRLDARTMIRRAGANLSSGSVFTGEQVDVTFSGPPGQDGAVGATFVQVAPTSAKAPPGRPAR